MRSMKTRTALVAALLALSLPVAAQKVKIENQGEAALTAEARALNAAEVEKALGKAPAGKAQVVFYRGATSPGPQVDVQESASSLVALDPGMYYVVATEPGKHAYATESGAFDITLEAGKTYYVQAIRNTAGKSQLRRSDAARFQRAAR